MDPYKKVRPGERLVISARAWNRAQDAADRVLGAGAGFTGVGWTEAEAASNIVLVRNDTNGTIQRFGVIGIGAALVDVEKVLPITVAGVLPKARKPFAVALEPIASGKVGRCAIGGAFPVYVQVCNASHMYANPKDGDTEKLHSNSVGLLQILTTLLGDGKRLVVGAM
jgi:hypothetical protein